MKLALLSLVAPLSLISGFTAPLSVSPKVSQTSSTLYAINDRRSFLKSSQTLATAAFVSTALPNIASAAEYVPKFDDLKVIYSLAASLDRLAVKCADPDQAETVLSSVKLFNKDPDFYPGMYNSNSIKV